MQSLFLQFFANLFHTFAYWFDESAIGRLFNKFCAALGRTFSHSGLSRLFTRSNWGCFFRESLFYKLLTLPLVLTKKMATHVGTFCAGAAQSSTVLWLLANWHSISIRMYGVAFCSFALVYGVLRTIFSFPTLYEWGLIISLFIVSLLCMFINRSLKSLFKGSRILTLIGGLFYHIKKDADSKLFLKDPEFLLSRPLGGIMIGALAALFAAPLPLAVFLLILAVVFYVALTLRYTIVGVFSVIIAAPVLPTMALATCCLLTVFSFMLRLATDKDFSLRQVPLAGYIIIFALTLVLGTLNSFTFVKSVQILFIHLAFIAFYFVAFQTLDSKKKWRGALISFLMVAAFVALYGVYQNFAGVSSTASWVDQEMFNQIKTRVYSTFDNPNVLGEYLVLIIPVTIAVIWRSQTNGQKTLFAALLLLLGVCIVFTWSRGAWLGVVLAVGSFLLIMDKRWWLLACLGLFLLPMLLSSGSAIAERILSIGNTADTSTAYRVSIWRASLDMLQDFWLGGIGTGSDAFSMIYPKYALAGANFALHSHNLFLQIWVELGIAGILSFLALILAFLRQSYSLAVYQNRGHLSPAVSMAFAAGILGFLFQGLTDNVWYNYKMVLLFWICLAFAGSATAPDFQMADKNNGGDRI